MPLVYRDLTQDKCFCPKCEPNPMSFFQGKPPELYVPPAGWARFAVKLSPRAQGRNIFSDWHVAYHKTKYDMVCPNITVTLIC